MKNSKGLSFQTVVKVYLEGRLMGEIREEVGSFPTWNEGKPGFRYYPKGGTRLNAGELHVSLENCQNSLK